MGFLLGRMTSVAYVATCHGFYKPRWFRRAFPCWGHNVIAISPAVTEHLEHDFGIAKDRIFQIKHGINVEDFPLVSPESRLRQRQIYGIRGTPAIGIIARLADVKGHDVLIRAMPEVLRNHPQAQLIIVGEGKQEPALRQLVAQLQLEKHIQFFPAINRTTEFLPAFDIFVMPSLSEGFGLSMIEAMAVGVPVVATRVGGIPSFIRNEETGLLVEPSRHEDLARNICRLLDEPQLAAGIMTAGRQLIERDYSADQMVQRTQEVYRLTYEQYSGRQR
jgi:glycosyltransferase involved in cell wall biosynthesis